MFTTMIRQHMWYLANFANLAYEAVCSYTSMSQPKYERFAGKDSITENIRRSRSGLTFV